MLLLASTREWLANRDTLKVLTKIHLSKTIQVTVYILMLTLDSVHLERIVWLGGISQKSIVCLLYKLGEHRTCLLYCQISNSRQTYRLIPARCNTGYAATITSTGFCHQFVLLCTPTGSIHIVQNMYLFKTCLLSPKLSSIYQDRLTLYKEHARASIGHQLL